MLHALIAKAATLADPRRAMSAPSWSRELHLRLAARAAPRGNQAALQRLEAAPGAVRVQRQAQSSSGAVRVQSERWLGGGEEDPIHAPLIEEYRRAHRQPPGGIDPVTGARVGPSDAELKYGGLLYESIRRLTVQLNVNVLAGVTDTVDRDVTRANSVLAPASIVLSARKSTLPAGDTPAILGSDNRLQCNPTGAGGAATLSSEEQQLITRNVVRGIINVYYVPGLVGRTDAGYTIEGAGPDPFIVMNQSFNAAATGIGTLEHEVGHALGLPHRGDGFQLMHDGLRGGNQLINSEIQAMRSSRYAR